MISIYSKLYWWWYIKISTTDHQADQTPKHFHQQYELSNQPPVNSNAVLIVHLQSWGKKKSKYDLRNISDTARNRTHNLFATPDLIKRIIFKMNIQFLNSYACKIRTTCLLFRHRRNFSDTAPASFLVPRSNKVHLHKQTKMKKNVNTNRMKIFYGLNTAQC